MLSPVRLIGLRESSWELRVSTGFITGISTVWFLFPRLEIMADRMFAAVGALTDARDDALHDGH